MWFHKNKSKAQIFPSKKELEPKYAKIEHAFATCGFPEDCGQCKFKTASLPNKVHKCILTDVLGQRQKFFYVHKPNDKHRKWHALIYREDIFKHLFHEHVSNGNTFGPHVSRNMVHKELSSFPTSRRSKQTRKEIIDLFFDTMPFLTTTKTAKLTLKQKWKSLPANVQPTTHRCQNHLHRQALMSFNDWLFDDAKINAKHINQQFGCKRDHILSQLDCRTNLTGAGLPVSDYLTRMSCDITDKTVSMTTDRSIKLHMQPPHAQFNEHLQLLLTVHNKQSKTKLTQQMIQEAVLNACTTAQDKWNIDGQLVIESTCLLIKFHTDKHTGKMMRVSEDPHCVHLKMSCGKQNQPTMIWRPVKFNSTETFEDLVLMLHR